MTSRQIWVPVSGQRVERWKPCGGSVGEDPWRRERVGGLEGRRIWPVDGLGEDGVSGGMKRLQDMTACEDRPAEQ